MYYRTRLFQQNYCLHHPTEVATFEQCGIKHPLTRSLYALGMEAPNSLQRACLPPILQGRNVTLRARLGHGSTTACVIGVLNKLQVGSEALIIVPTPAMSLETAQLLPRLSPADLHVEIVQLGRLTPNGAINNRKCCARVMIGTPQNALIAFQSKTVQADILLTVVVQQTSELNIRVHSRYLKSVFSQLKPNTQLIYINTSWGYPPIIQLSEFMRGSVVVALSPYHDNTVEGVNQFYVPCDREQWKLDTLKDIIQQIPNCRSNIFVNGQDRAEWISEQLRKQGLSAQSLTFAAGEKEGDARVRGYLNGEIGHLVRTDAMLVPSINDKVLFFISYDFPELPETLLQRVGRSGKFGRRAIHIILLKQGEERALQEHIRFLNTTIKELPDEFERMFF